MSRDFEQEKRQVLRRADKSTRGGMDQRITPLCDRVNAQPDYYTTSSCSGRILLVQAPEARTRDSARWVFVSHEPCAPDHLLEALQALPARQGEPVWLKLEPMILHVACRDLAAAQRLLERAQQQGFKQAALLSTTGKLVVQITAPERMECPVFHGELLMPPDSIARLVAWANTRLEQSWKRLERLEGLFGRHTAGNRG